MPFEQQLHRLRNITLSPNKQLAFGTALADLSLTQRPPVLDGTLFPQKSKTYYSNKNRANKGGQWATMRQKIREETAMQLSGDLTDWMAGYLLAFILMADTKTGAGPYTHTMKPLVSTTQAVVTTIYAEDTADLKAKWPDMAIAELELSGSDSGPLQFRASLVGSGRRAAGAMAAPISATAQTLLLGNDTDILLGAPGASASIKERIRGWTVTLAAGLVPHRAPGGGMFASFMRIESFMPKLQLVISAKDVDDVYTLFENDTQQECKINTNSGASAILNQTFSNIYFSAAQLGADGDDEIWQIETDENSIMKVGANEVYQAAVTNGEQNLLVGA